MAIVSTAAAVLFSSMFLASANSNSSESAEGTNAWPWFQSGGYRLKYPTGWTVEALSAPPGTGLVDHVMVISKPITEFPKDTHPGEWLHIMVSRKTASKEVITDCAERWTWFAAGINFDVCQRGQKPYRFRLEGERGSLRYLLDYESMEKTNRRLENVIRSLQTLPAERKPVQFGNGFTLSIPSEWSPTLDAKTDVLALNVQTMPYNVNVLAHLEAKNRTWFDAQRRTSEDSLPRIHGEDLLVKLTPVPGAKIFQVDSGSSPFDAKLGWVLARTGVVLDDGRVFLLTWTIQTNEPESKLQKKEWFPSSPIDAYDVWSVMTTLEASRK
jgi:hypothetical protein